MLLFLIFSCLSCFVSSFFVSITVQKGTNHPLPSSSENWVIWARETIGRNRLKKGGKKNGTHSPYCYTFSKFWNNQLHFLIICFESSPLIRFDVHQHLLFRFNTGKDIFILRWLCKSSVCNFLNRKYKQVFGFFRWVWMYKCKWI